MADRNQIARCPELRRFRRSTPSWRRPPSAKRVSTSLKSPCGTGDPSTNSRRCEELSHRAIGLRVRLERIWPLVPAALQIVLQLDRHGMAGEAIAVDLQVFGDALHI